jgi:hypothetical protein
MIKTSLGAQRYNNRMDKVYQRAIEALQKHCPHLDYTQKENTLTCTKCGLTIKQAKE